MTEVILNGLGKTYAGSGKPALSDLTLKLQSGSITALLGPSGCGKTTALKLVAGLLPASSGTITIDGKSPQSLPAGQDGAVMVFQAPLLFSHLTVAENIGFGLKMRKLPKAKITARVTEMLRLVQLEGRGSDRPVTLSGGQQQRVALARALVLRPKVLLLDEPLSNLDAGLRTEMRDLIRALQRELDITTLLVTHDREEAVSIADQLALILEGRLLQSGPPEEFYKRPITEEVARFFGGVNFIPGQVSGRRFISALGQLVVPEGLKQGEGILTFRPENLQFGRSGENALTAKLIERQYLGPQSKLVLKVGKTRVIAMTNSDLAASFTIGEELLANLPRQALWVLP